MLQLVYMFLGAYFALMFFITPASNLRQRMLFDSRAEAALEMSLIFAALTLVTGMIFSDAEWGTYWQWDPRQYSYLIAALMFGAYFAVRGAFGDPERRASHSAAYMLTAIAPIVFMVLVFPRLPSIESESLHPTDTITGGLLKGDYLYVTLSVLTLVTWITVWLYRMRVRVNFMEFELNNGKLETIRDAPAPVAVVRPVRVSRADGEQG